MMDVLACPFFVWQWVQDWVQRGCSHNIILLVGGFELKLLRARRDSVVAKFIYKLLHNNNIHVVLYLDQPFLTRKFFSDIPNKCDINYDNVKIAY